MESPQKSSLQGDHKAWGLGAPACAPKHKENPPHLLCCPSKGERGPIMEDRRPGGLAKERAWERGTEVKNQPFFGYPFPRRRSRKHTSGHKESPWTFL